MRAPLKATVAASAVVVALLIYVGHATARDDHPAPEASTPTAAVAPSAKASFAKIGIGACDDAKVEAAEPVVSVDSCRAPINHDMDLASLSVGETHAVTYR